MATFSFLLKREQYCLAIKHLYFETIIRCLEEQCKLQ